MTHDDITRIFREPPVLETRRLVLRKMQKRDSHDMYEYASRRDVTEYLLWDPHESEYYTYRYLSYIQSRYRAGDFHDWAGTVRENDKMIWEDGSDEAYTPWAAGEPSYKDSSDGVLEDYVLLWYNNGWFFNDSRHDPCTEFPQWYGGKMAYICEFGG